MLCSTWRMDVRRIRVLPGDLLLACSAPPYSRKECFTLQRITSHCYGDTWYSKIGSDLRCNTVSHFSIIIMLNTFLFYFGFYVFDVLIIFSDGRCIVWYVISGMSHGMI